MRQPKPPLRIVLLLALLAYLGCAALFGLSVLTPPFDWKNVKAAGIFLA